MRSPDRARRGGASRRRWAWAVALLPAAAALVLLLGQRWWLVDALAAFRAHLLVPLLVGAVLAVVLAVRAPRRGALVGALVAVAMLGVDVAMVVPLLNGRPADPGEGPTLTVAHVNLQKIDGSVDLLPFLEREDVDLFVVLEAPPRWFERLERGGVPGYELIEGPSSAYVVSRVPVRDIGDPDLGGNPRSTVELAVDVDGRALDLLAIHTSRPIRARGAEKRDEQLAAAATWARGRPDPVVVFGDLNATPWTRAFVELVDDADLRDSSRGFGLQPSWPAAFGILGIPIDQSLYRGDLVPVRRELGPTFGSGHRSLVVEYRLTG